MWHLFEKIRPFSYLLNNYPSTSLSLFYVEFDDPLTAACLVYQAAVNINGRENCDCM